jgi:hypothetical protein
MSKFKFVVCDSDYNEFVIESKQADKIYQVWVDAHPELGLTGEPKSDDNLVEQHWSVLIDIGQATFGAEFLVSTYTDISVI